MGKWKNGKRVILVGYLLKFRWREIGLISSFLAWYREGHGVPPNWAASSAKLIWGHLLVQSATQEALHPTCSTYCKCENVRCHFSIFILICESVWFMPAGPSICTWPRSIACLDGRPTSTRQRAERKMSAAIKAKWQICHQRRNQSCRFVMTRPGTHNTTSHMRAIWAARP